MLDMESLYECLNSWSRCGIDLHMFGNCMDRNRLEMIRKGLEIDCKGLEMDCKGSETDCKELEMDCKG